MIKYRKKITLCTSIHTYLCVDERKKVFKTKLGSSYMTLFLYYCSSINIIKKKRNLITCFHLKSVAKISFGKTAK